MSDWVVFCDGACSGNPGPGGWGTIVWNVEADYITELGGAEKSTTNNRMEMTALKAAFEMLADRIDSKVDAVWIVTDSTYVIRGLTEWVPNWKRSGWKKSDGETVANIDLWKDLDALKASIKNLEFFHIMGHAGIVENERVDEIGVRLSQDDKKLKLFSGARSEYEIKDAFQLGRRTLKEWIKELVLRSQSRPSKPKSKSTKAPGAYYVSVVKGEVLQHETWADCEKRVKGVSGAKFKKVKNETEEAEFLRGLKS